MRSHLQFAVKCARQHGHSATLVVSTVGRWMDEVRERHPHEGARSWGCLFEGTSRGQRMGFARRAPAERPMTRRGSHLLHLGPQALQSSWAAEIGAPSPKSGSTHRISNIEGSNLLLEPGADAVGECRMAEHHLDDGSIRSRPEHEGGSMDGRVPLTWSAVRLGTVDGLDLGATAAGSHESERVVGWLVPRAERVIIQLGRVDGLP